jgi:hypothetical protein
LTPEIGCERCGEAQPDAFVGEDVSAGVYVVGGYSYWAKYARPHEDIVCDSCMWADPLFQADYGVHV